jgi:hypothetical protein
MAAERNRSLTCPPNSDHVIDDLRLAVATREEAEEARRRAAEIGDYAAAERWFWPCWSPRRSCSPTHHRSGTAAGERVRIID